MKIYLGTRSKTSPFSWLIRFFTKSEISHVAITDISRDLVLQATFWDGLNFSTPKRFFKTYKVLHAFDFTPAIDQFDDVRDCYLNMMELVDSPFDSAAILGFIPYIIANKFGIQSYGNWWGKPSAIFCSESLFIFLQYCIDYGIITNVLKYYTREEFSPQDALELMTTYPDIFAVC